MTAADVLLLSGDLPLVSRVTCGAEAACGRPR